MIKIEKDKLVIEIPTSAPAELYFDLLQDILICVQAAQAGIKGETHDDLPSSIHFVLELYRAMLPANEEEMRKIFGKK